MAASTHIVSTLEFPWDVVDNSPGIALDIGELSDNALCEWKANSVC